MEAEVRVEGGIQIQEEVDEDTGVVCSVDNDDGNHVNKEKRSEDKKKKKKETTRTTKTSKEII